MSITYHQARAAELLQQKQELLKKEKALAQQLQNSVMRQLHTMGAMQLPLDLLLGAAYTAVQHYKENPDSKEVSAWRQAGAPFLYNKRPKASAKTSNSATDDQPAA